MLNPIEVPNATTLPTSSYLARLISVAFARELNAQTYVVGGAVRGDRTARDVDMVVMGASNRSVSVIYDVIQSITREYTEMRVEVVESSDPADKHQNDARFIFRFHCSDVPVELSIPWDDCNGIIYKYMKVAYPLSAQECCLIPNEHHYYDAWGTDTIYVKTWLNYEHALKKYREYYPDALFFMVNKLEHNQLLLSETSNHATYKERPCSL